MADEADPYEVLGVARDAGLDEVRAAFRKAALKVHPDTNPNPTAEAEAQFRQLVKAYQTISRNLGYSPWQDAEKYTPGDFARTDVDWFIGHPFLETPGQPPPPGTPKVKEARLDEPVVFLAIWGVAVVMGVLTAYIVMTGNFIYDRAQPLGVANILLVAAMTLGIYLGLVAGGLALLVLTRKTVWLIARFTLEFRSRRALPKPGKDFPRTAPKLPPKTPIKGK